MKVSEFVKWAEENHLEEAEIYVHGESGYEAIDSLWESERNDGSVIIEPKKA